MEALTCLEGRTLDNDHLLMPAFSTEGLSGAEIGISTVDVQSGVMFLTQQPIPKTIEDLGQEVTEDVLLARLEHQRALQVCWWW
jgi:hypothetical protein